MTEAAQRPAPGWQTEELQDEWIDLDPDELSGDDENNLTCGTRSISFTAPLATYIHTNTEHESTTSPLVGSVHAVGTFLVRNDIPDQPILPKTPGRNKKAFVKDFFTPLPLERMFEPPSPPTQQESKGFSSQLQVSSNSEKPESEEPSESQDEIIETDMRDMSSFHGRKPSIACHFTFSVPRDGALQPNSAVDGNFPQAESTPNPLPVVINDPPNTDPRLRLFQFQYDTYTRDHLSALVDSIAINTPSGAGTGTTPSPTINMTHGLSRVSEVSVSAASASHLRSSKRIKLSPASDFSSGGAGSGASITRPAIKGKDYVGESLNLMQQIKQARDFSTISTVISSQHNPLPVEEPEHHENDQQNSPPSAQKSQPKAQSQELESRRPSYLKVPTNTSSNNSSSSGTTGSGSAGSFSSSTYRQQAAALMAQIKSDMKGQKRIFSSDTDTSHFTMRTEISSRSPTPENHVLDLRGKNEKETNDNKTVSRNHRRTSSSRSSSSVNRAKNSPRRNVRRQQHEDAVNDSLTSNISRLTIKESTTKPIPAVSGAQQTTSQPTLIPQVTANARNSSGQPAYPSSSIRGNANEDLNRFVSSSTASGTTLTAGSAPSFVKHAGPAHIRTIAPSDIPTLPDRFGDMYFDKGMMKWVKSTAQATLDHNKSGALTEELSEDPFGDIESLRDDSAGKVNLMDVPVEEDYTVLKEMTRIEERSEADDDEEVELTSFSTDASAHIVSVMTGVNENDVNDDDETTDSADEDDMGDTAIATNGRIVDFDYSEDDMDASRFDDTVPSAPVLTSTADPAVAPNTPSRGNSRQASNTPIIRSVLKSHSATPTSALKDASRTKYQTPLQKKGHRRSVSFSDGKREGPIQDLHASTTDDGEGSGPPVNSATQSVTPANVVQSVRSRRIADMMHALEDSELEEERQKDGSPSKTSNSNRRPEQMRPFSEWQNTSNSSMSTRRVFSRSRTHRSSPSKTKNKNKSDGTFLTECSFGVAHDRLVEVITDVQPFDPYWEELEVIDLSDKRLESAARLKEFLPRLDTLNLNSNHLSYLSGVPGTVRTLSVASNNLTGVTSYSHLLNLENLDISYNQVDSLLQLECLRHLRELKADGNRINSIDGLQRMDGLVKLSLQGNCIRSIDLGQYRWTRLEMLNISRNCLESIHGLASLQALIALNLDSNQLKELVFNKTMSRLRILRVSGNRLGQLQASALPNLRTLYTDNNGLSTLAKVDRLTKLENLSMRNQSGRAFNLLTREVRDVKRLYLSGNALKSGFLQEPCYNLVYLELAACRLTALPEGLSRLAPNLRVLNLNYNFLEDARPLEGLTRLQKLTIIGSRLKSTKPLIRLLHRMPEVEMLDFRMNPCTLGWYLPLLVKDVPGALQPSEGAPDGKGERAAAQAWQELDSKFRRDLPDESYIGRLAYRGLIMRACPRVRMVDGVGVTEKERRKAHELLEGIFGEKAGVKGKGGIWT